jgi:hypothetical protein
LCHASIFFFQPRSCQSESPLVLQSDLRELSGFG